MPLLRIRKVLPAELLANLDQVVMVFALGSA